MGEVCACLGCNVNTRRSRCATGAYLSHTVCRVMLEHSANEEVNIGASMQMVSYLQMSNHFCARKHSQRRATLTRRLRLQRAAHAAAQAVCYSAWISDRRRPRRVSGKPDAATYDVSSELKC